jgi:hypothetical protein
MSAIRACTVIGEPLNRPVIKSTEDQKSHIFARLRVPVAAERPLEDRT